MKSNPEVIELDEADLESKLDQIEAVMGVDMARPFRLLLRWYARLLGLVREKKLSIRRLQRILFGASTERTSSVLSSAESSGQVEDMSAENPTEHPACHHETSSTADNQGHGGDCASDPLAPRRRRPGHGRIPASDYTGCAKAVVTHASLRPGDACPHCSSGNGLPTVALVAGGAFEGPASDHRSGLSTRAAALRKVRRHLHGRVARGCRTRQV